MAANPYLLLAGSPRMTAAAVARANDAVLARRTALVEDTVGSRVSKQLRHDMCRVRNTDWLIIEPLLRGRRFDELVDCLRQMAKAQWLAAVEPRTALLDRFVFTRRQAALCRDFRTRNGGARALEVLCSGGFRRFAPRFFVDMDRRLDAPLTSVERLVSLIDRVPHLKQRFLDLRAAYETPLAPLPYRVVYFYIVRPLMHGLPNVWDPAQKEDHEDVLRIIFDFFDGWTAANVCDVLIHVDFTTFADHMVINHYIKRATAVAILQHRYRRGLVTQGYVRQMAVLKLVYDFWFDDAPVRRPWPPTLLDLYADLLARVPNTEANRKTRQRLANLAHFERSGQFRFRHVSHDAAKSWLCFTVGKDVKVLLDTDSLGPRALTETTARLAGDPSLVVAIAAALDSIEVDTPLYHRVETEVPGAWANVPFPLPESLVDVPTIVVSGGEPLGGRENGEEKG